MRVCVRAFAGVLRSPYLEGFHFLVVLVGEGLEAGQLCLPVDAAPFEVFQHGFVHPLLQQRKLGRKEKRERERERGNW